MAGMLAIANVGRAAAFRSGYFLRNVVTATFGATQRSGVIQSSIRIDLNTGAEPHRCSFDLKGGNGFVPAAGTTVIIGHGTSDNSLFRGRILKVTRRAARNDDAPVYQCEAAGWLFDIDQSRVMPGFSVQSLAPRSLVQYLLKVTSPNVASLGFTASQIAPTLPLIEEFSTGPLETISDALDRIFKSVDATWYMDLHGDIHAFTGVNSTPAIPSTITSAASHVWNVQYSPTDFSRVFTRVHVAGAVQPTLADVDLSVHTMIPLASASMLSNYEGVDSDILAGTTEQYLLGQHLHIGSLIYRPEQSFEPSMVAGTFLDTLAGANTLVVVSKNVSSVRPMESPRWYAIAGQNIYTSSVLGVYSATAGSIAYGYRVNASGPGAIQADIPSGSEIAGVFNLAVASVAQSRFVPAGEPVQVFATRVNSAGVDYIQSLTTSAAYGLISRSFEDQRLSPDGAAAVASTALQRGDPAQWASLDFTTRDEGYTVGGPVFVSMTSPTEPSGYSIAGTFTAQDITISEFGTLTKTRGPQRTIRAGVVRRPTMWQVLRGD